MSFRLSALLLSFLAAAPVLLSAEDSPAAAVEEANPEAVARRDAKVAMESWVEFIKEGRYIESWKAASVPFQKSVSAGQWAITCRNQHRRTGPEVNRTLKETYYNTEYYTSDGRMEKGEIVTFLFTTDFEYLKEATEVVILRPFPEGWKVVSYRLKPKGS